ncbi:MAG TPA: hypothetical protein DHV62_05485 [Elusimicrobia bacterium]|nr:hypothetical protein [Elusimicrobiota bacterium]
MAKVVILLVLHNEERFLPGLFDSLDKQSYKNFQIICIDNNSQDNSKDFIRRNYPQVKIIENSQNVFVAKAFNQGLIEALENGAEFIFDMTPDGVVEKGCLSALLDVLEKNKNLAAAQPIVLFWDEKEKINTSGNAIHFLGFGYSKGRGLDIRCMPAQGHPVNYSSGPAHLWRAQVLKELGGFDENSFLIEDLDLGWRAWLLGYQIVNVPEAIVYHKYSFSRYKKKYYFLEKGRLS